MVISDPVADVECAGANATVEPTAPDRDAVKERAEHDVAAFLALASPRFDQRDAFGDRLWFKFDPGHPRSEMLNVALDEVAEYRGFVVLPTPQE
jgi:hypothetical protein